MAYPTSENHQVIEPERQLDGPWSIGSQQQEAKSAPTSMTKLLRREFDESQELQSHAHVV